ncbi:MAG: hypothetical protein KIT33_00615 [Candidatus Kapabacteria bacterium]|nr:hypothetical protein [Ignavibacteriota bacterium]MCW5883449.1 hypothetical protein [Candidatus Kapabacteria bacterium]
MIEILIFYLHIAGALYAFTKSWQNVSLKEGFMAILMIGLFFAIGWALTGTLARLIYPDSWNSIYFSSDTLSLVLLLIPEIIFFYFFFIKAKNL